MGSGSISSLGIGSGFLNNDLLDQLAQAQREPVEQRLDFEQQQTEAKLSAIGQFKSAVSNFGDATRDLSDPTALRSFTGESSSDAVGVSVDEESVNAGSFDVEVTQLAQAQALKSNTFADRDSTPVGTGDLTFEVGDQNATITLDNSNNTLNGLASEINEGGFGVNASVLDTGNGFSLVLNSAETGEANALSITAGNASLDEFNFNETDQNLTETRAASDAELSVSGVTITRSSNTVENVIDGVTFELNETTTSPANVTIAQDLNGPTEQVQSLVDQFNALRDTANEFTAFDPEAGEGSILSGEATIRSTMNQLNREIGRVVPGLENANVRALSDVGITTDANSGRLQFDSARFQEQLQNNPDDVTALFAEQGRTSDGQVDFVRSGIDTQPGEFAVNVDSVATRGSLAGDAAVAANVTIDANNKTFSLALNDGTEAEITLTEDTFTREELVNEIQTQVNDNAVLQDQEGSLQVGLTAGNRLELTSSTFGSNSTVAITNASQEVTDTLGLSEGAGTAGTDVQGSIDGREAQGDGKILFLGSGEGDASGIQLRINGSETGDRGTVSFIEGVGNRLTERVNQLQSGDGALTSREESFQNELDDISEDRQDLNDRISTLRERLNRQFAAADSRISQFQQTGNFLEQQLAGLTGNNN